MAFKYIRKPIGNFYLNLYSGTPVIMKFTRTLVSIATLSAVAILGQIGNAQAFSFSVDNGIAAQDGTKNKGAFSKFSGLSTVKTVDFNSGSAPTTGFAKYSFQNASGSSSVREDRWAPAGVNGEVNKSKYLAVFDGNKVDIKLGTSVNYFGVGLGAISPGNTFSFYRGNTLVKSYSTADFNAAASLQAAQHGGEKNGFGHFYANNASESFDRMVISQVGGGGFETDNHAFNIGSGGFNFDDPSKSVPEPGIMLGLAAIGGSVFAKRKRG
jgi:hypothetical protein